MTVNSPITQSGQGTKNICKSVVLLCSPYLIALPTLVAVRTELGGEWQMGGKGVMSPSVGVTICVTWGYGMDETFVWNVLV